MASKNDMKNTYIIISAIFVGFGLLLLFVFIQGFDPYTTDLSAIFSSPSNDHWFGTDHLGRDYLSRIVLGTGITLIFAIIIQAIAVTIGSISGIYSGYFESGWFDKIVNEYMNVVFAIPSILLILTVTAVIGKSILNIGFTLGLILWIKSSSIIRGRVLIIRKRDYILAAQVLGIKKIHIMGKYIFSELVKDIGFIYIIGLLDAILLETGLSLLGLGVQPPTPSLGVLLRDGMHYMGIHTRFVFIPGFILVLFTGCITLIIQKKENVNA